MCISCACTVQPESKDPTPLALFHRSQLYWWDNVLGTLGKLDTLNVSEP